MDGDYYLDVTVKSISVRSKIAVVRFDNGGTLEVAINELEQPLTSDVNERFGYFRTLAGLTLQKKLPALIVSGEGGIGKSFELQGLLALNGLVEDEHYMMIKGATTARGLFDLLDSNQDRICIFDDCDSGLRDKEAQNIYKTVLDTTGKRKVSWNTFKKGRETFEFRGSAIFLSNMDKDDLPQPIISRSLIVDLFMTPEEKITRMEFILPTLQPSVPLEEKIEVLRIIDKYKYTIYDLNLRTLIKALVVYHESKASSTLEEALNIVRYTVLNGSAHISRK